MAARKRQKRHRKPPPIDIATLKIKAPDVRAYSRTPTVSSLIRQRFCFRPLFDYAFRRILPKDVDVDGVVADISSGHLASCPWLENLLRTEIVEMATRWRKTRIRRILNDCVPRPPVNTALSYANSLKQTVTYNQLRVFISKCFSMVLPSGFVGPSNSPLLIDDFSKLIFEANIGEILDLQPTIRKLKISEMRWIKKCRVQPLQVVLLNDCVNFVFSLVLGCVLSVMKLAEVNRVKGATVLYRYDLWRALEKKGLEDFMATQKCESIQMPARNSSELAASSVMRFQVRSHGLRPIVRMLDQEQIARQRQANAILRYIIDKNQSQQCKTGSLAQFPKLFRHFRRHQRFSPSKKFYLFTGDVANCFPNIDHGELRKIIENLSAKHEGYFVASERGRCVQAAGLSTTEASNRYRLTLKGSTRGNLGFKRLSRQEFMDSIDFCRTIRYKDRMLRTNRGIGQGSNTSGSLCELFLAHIEREALSGIIRPHQTFMFRYADDYLIISSSEKQISSVVLKLIDALARYGLQMKTNKMCMNFKLPQCEKTGNIQFELQFEVKWCGFKINDQLAVDVDVKRIRRQPLHVPLRPRDGFHIRKRKLAVRLKILLSRKYLALRRISSLAVKAALPKLLLYDPSHRVHEGTRRYLKRLRIWAASGFPNTFPFDSQLANHERGSSFFSWMSDVSDPRHDKIAHYFRFDLCLNPIFYYRTSPVHFKGYTKKKCRHSKIYPKAPSPKGGQKERQ